jgi:lipoprotein
MKIMLFLCLALFLSACDNSTQNKNQRTAELEDSSAMINTSIKESKKSSDDILAEMRHCIDSKNYSKISSLFYQLKQDYPAETSKIANARKMVQEAGKARKSEAEKVARSNSVGRSNNQVRQSNNRTVQTESLNAFSISDSKVFVMSQDFVKAKIRYPKEAKFQSNFICEQKSDGSYNLLAKFTAKNAYGVTSEYVYKINLVYSGGDWSNRANWRCLSLILEDTSTGEQYI